MSGLLVLGGPTASGKSALALRLALALDGVLVNADSMQLYRELPLLTARPTPADEARVPHRLYGVLGAAEPASVGRWLELAGRCDRGRQRAGRLPIVVGGTGLYLSALLRGLAPVPPVPAAVRAEARALFDRLGAPGFHAELARRDPVMAARLRPSDRQRLLRAFEVLAATGRSLADWQAQPRFRLRLPAPVVGLALLPPRAELHAPDRTPAAGDDRGGRARGAGGAAARLRQCRLPLLKAVAVPELCAHLDGRLDLAAGAGACARADPPVRQAPDDLAAPSAARAGAACRVRR